MTAIICYNEGDPLSKLVGLRKKYLKELEEVYDKTYSGKEWEKIVNSSDYGTVFLGPGGGGGVKLELIFSKKPSFGDFYQYNKDGVFPFKKIKPKLDKVVLFNINDRDFKSSYNSLIKGIGLVKGAPASPPSEQTLRDEIIEAMNEAFKYVGGDFLNDNLATYEQKIEDYKNRISHLFNPVPTGMSKPVMENFVRNLDDLRNNVKSKAESAKGLCIDNVEGFLEDAVRSLFLDQINNLIAKIEANREANKAKTTSQFLDSKYQEAIDKLEKRKNKILGSIEQSEADQVIFREQCFMLANLVDLVEFRKIDTYLNIPYATYTTNETGSGPVFQPYNSPINIQGSAFAFINKLAVSPDQKFLFDLKSEELSSITPSMRFYKVDSDPTDGKDTSTEITFDINSSKDLDGYMSRTSTMKQSGRGLGVGVKSFDFSYEGTDPFSAKKAITAKLVLYAPNFSDLLRERKGDNGTRYSYVDLALKTGKYRGKEAEAAAQRAKDGDQFSKEKENLDKLNFRLKAKVLWSASKESLRVLDDDKKNAIYNSAISFYLTPTIHEFDFDDTGAVTFTINYLAYIEDYFAQPQFDIFGNTGADKEYRDLVNDYFRQADCDTTGYDEFKKLDDEYVSSVNTNSLNEVVKLLRGRSLMYYLSVSKEEMSEWLRNPVEADFGQRVAQFPETNITDAMLAAAVKGATSAKSDDKPSKEAYRYSLVANSDLRENIAYFYLSDLVDVVMRIVELSLNESGATEGYYEKVIKKTFTGSEEIKTFVDKKIKHTKTKSKATQEQFKKIRVVLGPIQITPYTAKRQTQKLYSGTIGDIPISLNYFLDFMSEKVLSNEFISYPLTKFIKDLINDCMKNYLNSDSCLRTDSSQRVSLNSTTVLAYNEIESDVADDDLSNIIIEGDGKWSEKGCLLLNNESLKEKRPLLKISGPNDHRTSLDISKMRNYYIFSIGKTYPTDKYVGKASIDAKSGIFHYVLGADKGIVKNISLDKTSTPGLKELRFEQEGFDGLTQLREVYNANITTFLNPQTFPGTYIYVEPKGFDPTAQEDLSKYGIGGYYMITKTSHSIQPGSAETNINASWVADKGGKVVKNEGTGESKTEDDKQTNILKCRVSAISNSGRS